MNRKVATIGVLLLLGAYGLLAQDSAPRFEIVSVRPAGPVPKGTAQFPGGRKSGGPGTNDPGRVRYERVPLLQLICDAYGVTSDQISGPGWATTYDLADAARYDISAEIPPRTTEAQLAVMLQNLLADRLGLVIHRKKIERSGFALVVAKAGAKIAASSGPVRDSERLTATGGPIRLESQADGFPQLFPGSNMGATFKGGQVRMRFRDYDLADFAQQLQGGLGIPILDATGLTGKYDFKLEFVLPPEDAGVGVMIKLGVASGQVAPVNPNGATAAQQDAAAIISSAMEKQLGLKIQGRRVPVDLLVIDHVNREPKAN